ncbi:Ig-like domain-containing protein [Sulfitobacter sp. LCG007]
MQATTFRALRRTLAKVSGGHLALVLVDGSSQLEIEVQAPNIATIGFGGDFQYPEIRDHLTNTPNIDEEDGYATADIELKDGQTATGIWNILSQIHGQFSNNFNSIDYNTYQNSNSYATTLLWAVGIDPFTYIPGATPEWVQDGFPGDTTNLLTDQQGSGEQIYLTLTGSNEVDHFRTGDGNDTLNGGGGNDILNGGGGNDQINGGAGDDTLVIDIDDTTVSGGADFDTAYLTGTDHYTIDMAQMEVEAVIGGGGNDTIIALIEDDSDPNTSSFGSDGHLILAGGQGADRLVVTYEDVSGGSFPLVPLQQPDHLPVYFGGEGADTFVIDAGAGILVIEADITEANVSNFSLAALGYSFDLSQFGAVIINPDASDMIELHYETQYGVEDVLLNVGSFGDHGTYGYDSFINPFFDGTGSPSGSFVYGGSTNIFGGGNIEIFGNLASVDGIPAPEYQDFDGNVYLNGSGWFMAGGTVSGTQIQTTGGMFSVTLGTEDNDIFNGTAGSDWFVASGGSDTYNGSGGGFQSFAAGTAESSASNNVETDRVSYGGSSAGVTVNLATGVGAGGLAEGDTYTDIEDISGSAYADTLIGNDAANTFYGGNGSDVLSGGANDDVLQGGAGDDVLTGGAGNDTLIGGRDTDTAVFNIDFAEATISVLGERLVVVSASEGTDLVESDVEYLAFKDITYSFAELLGNSNRAPLSAPDTLTVGENQVAEIDVIANDSDADGDPLTLTRVGGQAISLGNPVTLMSGAIVSLLPNGALSYDPNGAFESLGTDETASDIFSYTVSDGQGGITDGTLSVTIEGFTPPPPNENPIATDDIATIEAGGWALIDVLANDTDADGDALIVSSVSGATNGTAVIEAGQVRYTANAGFVGEETLTYEISDGQGGTATGSVTITVNPATGPVGNQTGTSGVDVYYHTIGNGSYSIQDLSYDASVNDRLVFTDQNASDVTFVQNAGEDLLITTSAGEVITIIDHFDGTYEDMELIEFADGTVLDAQAIRDKSVSDMKATGAVIGSNQSETYTHALGDGSFHPGGQLFQSRPPDLHGCECG